MELKKGQKVKITDFTSSKQIQLQISAQMKTEEADISCFGVDNQNKLSDDRYFVFYNQLHTPENAITMKKENTKTIFSIDFEKIPLSIKKLVFTIAADGSALMKDIQKGEFSLFANQQELLNFPILGQSFQEEKAVILCEIYEKDGVWRLSAVSSGFNGGLSALLAYFGGEEIKEEEIKEEEIKEERTPAKPISLKKSGDTHKISLEKNAKEIYVNLNWNTEAGKKKGLFGFMDNSAIDLDLACMYRLKTGHQGVIQALGNSFGCASSVPYIFLDQDDRTGGSINGENMWFKKPDSIDFAIVFAYIYEGTPNWKDTNARVILKQQGAPDIEIFIDNPDKYNRFCVIASLTGKGNQLEVKREERFFKSHREVDYAYGFGFRWTVGHK